MDGELANIHGQHEEDRKRLVQALCDGELNVIKYDLFVRGKHPCYKKWQMLISSFFDY